ncbi:MAG: DUF2141 domain-containing protein [Verrucomicrobiales bacterium]|nr:DUF2141 domain-containing protein [Verrucomicrobiales bacterium]
MKVISALFVLALPCLLIADEAGVTLRITVSNIPGVKGNLLVGLFDSEKSFTKSPMAVSPKVKVVSTDDLVVEIPNVKPGTYAVSVVQDLNGNGKLDKSFVGMPKEPLAFSVIPEIPRGKPEFDDCSFAVGEEGVEMTISLVTR